MEREPAPLKMVRNLVDGDMGGTFLETQADR